jgi:hypothetical protein
VQGQIFIAVDLKAKYRGTATSKNEKYHGHIAVKIGNIAVLSR